MQTLHREPSPRRRGLLRGDVLHLRAEPDERRQRARESARSERDQEGEMKRTEPAARWPEHERLHAVADDSQKLGDFLEWCQRQRLALMAWQDDPARGDGGSWRPDRRGIPDLLAAYFGIDQAALEAEQRAMLEALRTTAAGTGEA